jgi:antitoxin FitA
MEPTVAVNLSIKNAPEDVVDRLRARAARHHRSLQGELLAIVEEAVRLPEQLTPEELLVEVRRLGVRTPAEAATIARDDRDGR